MFDVRTYLPGGETLRRFHESGAFVRLMAGPIGSGKTVAAGVAEPFFTGLTQLPDANGVRYADVGILRDTYRNLYATTMKTWLDWVPKDFGHFTGSDDRPALHDLTFEAPYVEGIHSRQEVAQGGGKVHLRVSWRALGANTVEATCRGWELHGAGADEMDTMPIEALAFLRGRVKRGGRKEYRRSRGVWATFNKPDTDHPLFDMCVERAESHAEDRVEFFDQPSGILPGGPPYVVNPLAENLSNLDADYYQMAAAGQADWYVRRMIRNLWGASVSGEPLFGAVNLDRLFSTVEFEPEPGQELVIGLDGGGTPAAVIFGRDRYGRRIVYAELVLVDPLNPRRILTGVGPKRFAAALKDLVNASRFRGCRFSIGWGDPAAFFGGDREFSDFPFMEEVGQLLNLPIQSAPSNSLETRFEAVRTLMLVDNTFTHTPDLVINPSCRWLRRGFAGDYRWTARDPLQPAKRLKPQKTNSSHVMEALQYGLLGDQGRAAVVAGKAWDPHRPRQFGAGEAGGSDGWGLSGGGVLVPGHARSHSEYRSDWSPFDD